MDTISTFSPSWTVACVLGLGLLSAWFARVGAGSSQQTTSQILFFGCLAMVAVATILSTGVGPGCWLASVSTFASMVLAATADTRRSREIASPYPSSHRPF